MANVRILDGTDSDTIILVDDTDRQIASIYSFAKSANGEPEGFPTLGGSEFELIPKDRPIVQRTFMEGAGTHTILVGFPTGVLLAYDPRTAGGRRGACGVAGGEPRRGGQAPPGQAPPGQAPPGQGPARIAWAVVRGSVL